MSHVLKIKSKVNNERILRKTLKENQFGDMSTDMQHVNLGYGNSRLGYKINISDLPNISICWNKKSGFMYDAMNKDKIQEKLTVIENHYLKNIVINKITNEGISNYNLIKNDSNHIIIEYEI